MCALCIYVQLQDNCWIALCKWSLNIENNWRPFQEKLEYTQNFEQFPI
jgi:hypothetical protein